MGALARTNGRSLKTELRANGTSTEARWIRLPPPARYALQGLTYLACQPDYAFCLAEDAARAEGLPSNFLSKIFQRLAHAGLLASRRGRGGGYALARPSAEIALAEIVAAAADSAEEVKRCVLDGRACGLEPCAIHETVKAADESLRNALESLTLADLAALRAK